MSRPGAIIPANVTVVVPCYNHAAYVTSCLDAIDAQDVEGLEIIVIDDGSKDATWERIQAKQFRPMHRVHKIRQDNAGAHAAINRGLKMATGRYVTICNSDDAFMPNRLARLLEVVAATRARFAFTGIRFVDAHDSDITQSWDYARDIFNKQREISLAASVGFSLVLSNVAVTTGNFFFERALLDEVGYFRPYRYCHDWDFILRTLLVTEPVYLPEQLYRYRLHASNSFLALAEAAAQECPELMRRFLKAANGAATQNPLCPSARNWPSYFEHFVHKNHYEAYMVAWEQVDGPRYNPFAGAAPQASVRGAAQ